MIVLSHVDPRGDMVWSRCETVTGGYQMHIQCPFLPLGQRQTFSVSWFVALQMSWQSTHTLGRSHPQANRHTSIHCHSQQTGLNGILLWPHFQTKANNQGCSSHSAIQVLRNWNAKTDNDDWQWLQVPCPSIRNAIDWSDAAWEPHLACFIQQTINVRGCRMTKRFLPINRNEGVAETPQSFQSSWGSHSIFYIMFWWQDGRFQLSHGGTNLL